MAKKKKKRGIGAIIDALTPFSTVGPFGTSSTSGNTYTYSPNYLPGQREGLELSSQKLTDTLRGVPTTFDIGDAFGNAFVDNSRELLNRPVRRRQEEDARELNNRLSASNQLGSSYDAYNRDLLSRRYDDLYLDNEREARNVGFDAYRNLNQDRLDTVNTLRGDLTSGINQVQSGLNSALDIQKTLSPLQSLQASYLNAENNYQRQAEALKPSKSSRLLDALSLFSDVANVATGGSFPKIPNLSRYLPNKPPRLAGF